MGLRAKIQTGLDENRMLVLGVQVLIGVQFQAAFQSNFGALSPTSQQLLVVALVMMVLAFAGLLVPASIHRIVFGGQDVPQINVLVTWIGWAGLVPLVLGLGIDLLVAGEVVFGLATGIAMGIGGCVVGFGLLHGIELIQRFRRAPFTREKETMAAQQPLEPTPLKNKLRQVMTESRIVLPGAQALLGFQFIAVLTIEFTRLSSASKVVHLASLLCTALAIILLLAPAAYHRVVERGEDSEQALHFAGVMVIAAMVPLSLGMSGDVFVVIDRVLHTPRAAAAAASGVLALMWSLWFGLTLVLRARRRALSS